MKKIHFVIMLAITPLLSGCPYATNHDIDVGIEYHDEKLVGNWKFIGRRIHSDNAYAVSNHMLHIVDFTNKTYVAVISDSAGTIGADIALLRTRRYKDLTFLSCELRNINYKKEDTLFFYYRINYHADTLILTEVNEVLISKFDAHQTISFKEMIPHMDKEGYKGDEYMYLKRE